MATATTGHCDLKTPVRNRYFYGKLLDVFHFEMEQNYLNAKRWLLNRLVTGYGVVCGLDVQPGDDGNSIVVTPGVAIDKCGREIIVTQESRPFTLPAAPASPAQPAPTPGGSDKCCDGNWVNLALCFHECYCDPVPAFGGDCDSNPVCASGAVKEQYEIEWHYGKLDVPNNSSLFADLFTGGRINYTALANYVSRPCPNLCDHCCIPLANIKLPDQGAKLEQSGIDIAVRPVVYTNDLLYGLIIAGMNTDQTQSRGGKP
ncbi:MAG: hypothetical protein LAO20_00330 [Acidobacteriia bacterium]|nr:hypothetical protein [Terriglobia bacterium]